MRVSFLYDDYIRSNLTAPLFAVFFCSIMIILNIKTLFLIIKSIFEAIKSRDKYAVGDVIEKHIVAIIVMILCVFLLFVNISPLTSGGIHLINEKETDAVYTKGIIQSIEQLNQYSSPKYQTDYGTTFGARVNIDGDIYNIITVEEFAVGDNVKIKYLPKSKFILEMQSD